MEARDEDRLQPFLIEDCGVRGVLVRLGPSWREIRSHARSGPALRRLLGEAVAASALLTAHIKRGTRTSLQLQSAGPLATLFADCSGRGELRGLVRARGPLPDPIALDHLGPEALLAVCLEQPDGQRYQGLVPLEAPTLEAALEGYFRRSEQIATRIRLAADDTRAAGIMIQLLPSAPDDYEPAPAAFTLLAAPLGHLGPPSLLGDPPERLLPALFPERPLRLAAGRELRFGCGCSREKAAAMLRLLGAEETRAALADRAELEVSCEFCDRSYRFDAEALAAIHRGAGEAPLTRH
ncbi:MAG: Hsp33 family molecular chaperone HslO [Xanthomonadales bacterium]|nr:Hsp33 family molecular chaperone HslO [Xanthomonadales bacterium]